MYSVGSIVIRQPQFIVAARNTREHVSLCFSFSHTILFDPSRLIRPTERSILPRSRPLPAPRPRPPSHPRVNGAKINILQVVLPPPAHGT